MSLPVIMSSAPVSARFSANPNTAVNSIIPNAVQFAADTPPVIKNSKPKPGLPTRVLQGAKRYVSTVAQAMTRYVWYGLGDLFRPNATPERRLSSALNWGLELFTVASTVFSLGILGFTLVLSPALGHLAWAMVWDGPKAVIAGEKP